ncbi:hypothetical protein QTO30_13685 [Yoonia sp. GPGPB17]|uniref:HlyD family efflux transporter periplasmic adaptor subunit n=1 Tax=Yoonia sp. GPGPB17 TaxID=3026147 RepID=UPI0030C4B535
MRPLWRRASGSVLSQSYGRVYGFDSIEVTVSLSAEELALLDRVAGTPATVTARVLGKPVTLQGSVTRIEGEVNRATRLTQIIVGLDPAVVRDVGLQPGTFVTVAFDGPEIENVAEVPNAALQENDQVWLLDGDQLFLTEDLRVILRGRDTTLVTGLEDGARIALGTIASAANGMRIRAEAVAGPDIHSASLSEGDAE